MGGKALHQYVTGWLSDIDRAVLHCILWISFSLVIFSVDASANAANQWCKFADSAYFEEQANQLAEKGKDENLVQCPVIAKASTLPETLYLPMPCGQYMTFRRIEVQDLDQNNLLDFTKVYPGLYESGAKGVKNGRRAEVVSGAFFPVEKQGKKGVYAPRRYFYIAKYETTSIQYTMLKQGLFAKGVADYIPGQNSMQNSKTCNSFSKQYLKDDMILTAASGMPWFSAIEFSRVYTEWLMRADKQRIEHKMDTLLPWVAGSSGYLRLPTDAEWDYSARGPWAVDRDNNKKVYPVREENGGLVAPSLIDAGAEVDRGGSTMPVGLDVPNLFGIYGLMSGVGEMLFEFYRFTRPDGTPYGPPGGYIVRGASESGNGNRENINSRLEKPFFNNNRASKGADTGFRLVVSAPNEFSLGKPGALGIGIDKAYAAALQNSWRKHSSSPDSKLRKQQEEADKLLADAKASQYELRKKLIEITAESRRREADIRDKETENIRQRLIGLIFLAKDINAQGRSLLSMLKGTILAIEGLKKSDLSRKDLNTNLSMEKKRFEKIYKKRIEKRDREMRVSFKHYVTEITWLARTGNAQQPEWLDGVIRDVTSRLKDAGIVGAKALVEFVAKHLRQAVSNHGVVSAKTRKAWLLELDQFQVKRNYFMKQIQAL